METVALAPGYRISRLLKGGWQLSQGHGSAPAQTDAALADMGSFADAGFTAFDCADIYTGVEELIGAFRDRYRSMRGQQALDRIKIHTKFVPDWSLLPRIDRAAVAETIDRSRQRLRQDRLDLVQFHWWNYEVPRLLDTASWLGELQREGKIDRLGVTNFDTAHVRALLDAGIDIRSAQIQYSLLDARPENGLAALAVERGFGLLCYGALAGGFLGKRWLDRPEPVDPLENRSLVKYKLIIDEFGGWELFQALLHAAKRIADKHGVGIGAVAIRFVLDRPGVAGVIVGARNANHLPPLLAVDRLRLDQEDKAALAAVLAQRKGPQGDVFALERDRTGRHGRIMKYELNAGT